MNTVLKRIVFTSVRSFSSPHQLLNQNQHLHRVHLKFGQQFWRKMSGEVLEKPKIVFVLGAPGSGKGTQCSNIVDEYNYVHLSAGDLLRAERNRPGSELAQTIEEYIQAGRIIPVAVTCSLLERAMNDQMKVSCEKKVYVFNWPFAVVVMREKNEKAVTLDDIYSQKKPKMSIFHYVNVFESQFRNQNSIFMYKN